MCVRAVKNVCQRLNLDSDAKFAQPVRRVSTHTHTQSIAQVTKSEQAAHEGEKTLPKTN